MSNSYYRIQNANREVTDLLIADEQVSRNHADETSVRVGVSVCDDLEALAEYVAQTGMILNWAATVLVEVEGYMSTDTPEDAHLGERLIHPTRIVSVVETPDEFFEAVNAAYDRIYETA